jgi:hypothetical protein
VKRRQDAHDDDLGFPLSKAVSLNAAGTRSAPFPQFRGVPSGVVRVIPRIAAFSAIVIRLSLRGATAG